MNKWLLTGSMLISLFITGGTGKAHHGSGNNLLTCQAHAPKSTVATPEEDDYDVLYVKMDLHAHNTSTQIKGHVTTRVKVVAPVMTDYFFELTPQLTIDSVLIQGASLPVTSNNFIRSVTLPSAFIAGDTFSVSVYYQGAPAGGGSFFNIGIMQTTAPLPYNVPVTQTVSAAYHSRDWWPVKQSLTDKIDSADIWITVPQGLTAASNGLLKQVVPIGTAESRFEWSTRYPIDYYLLSFAVAPYQEYSYYMHFSGSNDSLLIQNFLYDHPSVLANHQDELDSMALLIDYFSEIFGRYPFGREKAGSCMVPLSGGMENQTMVSLGDLEITLIAHELAHEWWGNHVTCSSFEDIWLNEGMATYAEHLYIEHFRSPEAARAYRAQVFNSITSAPGGSVRNPDTTSETRIYSSRLTYKKGAALAHMLRYYLDNDNIFFQALRDFQDQFAYGTANTGDFKQLAEQVSGISLDTFFHQWYSGEGYPVYAAKWHRDPNTHLVTIRLQQHSSQPQSVGLFKLPVELLLTGPNGDTLIRVENDQNVQFYTLYWDQPMSGLVIDPGNHIIRKTGTIKEDAGILHLTEPAGSSGIYVFPNPASEAWHLRGIPEKAVLTLLDVSGKQIWRAAAITDTFSIPAADKAKGIYLLNITSKDQTKSLLLVR